MIMTCITPCKKDVGGLCMLLLLHVHCLSSPTLLISLAIITAFAYDCILLLSLILALSSNLTVCLLMFEFHLANINAVVRGWTRLRDYYIQN